MSTYSILVQGKSYLVALRSRHGSTLSFAVDDIEYSVSVAVSVVPLLKSPRATSTDVNTAQSASSTIKELRTPLPGIVSEIKVKEGQTVQKGDTLLVIEAMKMENPIRSPRGGIVSKIHVSKDQEVPSGAVLVSFES